MNGIIPCNQRTGLTPLTVETLRTVLTPLTVDALSSVEVTPIHYETTIEGWMDKASVFHPESNPSTRTYAAAQEVSPTNGSFHRLKDSTSPAGPQAMNAEKFLPWVEATTVNRIAPVAQAAFMTNEPLPGANPPPPQGSSNFQSLRDRLKGAGVTIGSPQPSIISKSSNVSPAPSDSWFHVEQ